MLTLPALRARILAAACLLLIASSVFAQKPGEAELNEAYRKRAAKDYDGAIVLFRRALEQQTTNAAAHKDLAYALLKTGENAQARDEFAQALKLDATDENAALEYAFLAYETKKPVEARRTFDKLRRSTEASTRAAAERAFENIDRPLRDGIARWQEALKRAPDGLAPATFSAHWELGRLAELRDDEPLAAEQYAICHRLRPKLGEILLMLGRVWSALDRKAEAQAALLAASRSDDSRTAELAVEEMGTRYPYPYEFLDALKLDGQNANLRRELAFLYLAMHKEAEATEQFQQLLTIDPHDDLARKQLDLLRGLKTRAVVTPSQPSATVVDAKAMGKKSLALGYLHDAVKYFQLAHEQDPSDAGVMLQLGWAYNQSKQDSEAMEWFDRARRSNDAAVAAEASKAFHNLNGDTLPATTIWTLPMFSSRWKDAFSYGQIKRTVPLPFLGKTNKLISVYLSTRFVGDVRGSVPGQDARPQYLSETSFVFGAGISTKTWRHFTGWAEAGEALKYLPSRHDAGTAIPDYRGGLIFEKGFGTLLGAQRSGFFYETTDDALYMSRFDKDWLFHSQHRAGRTFLFARNLSGQLLLNANYTRDVKGEDWANTVEAGPGVKLRAPWMPANMYFSTDFLRGFYTNSNRHHYNDVRVSLWYAVTK